MTDKDLIQALRCIGSPDFQCQESCPFHSREVAQEALRAEVGGAARWDNCDCDGIVMAAADRLEAILAENERPKVQEV